MKIIKIYLLVPVLFFAVCQLQAELVGHWRFDNPADLGYDSSGMNNHGSIAAGTPLYSTDSIRGAGAIVFDGIDDYLYLYDTGQGSLNGDFTAQTASVSMWIKLDNAIPVIIVLFVQSSAVNPTGKAPLPCWASIHLP